ncbi:MAG: flavodoxin domain-containing protein [Desulfatibacillaceae bacterium]|nr:flavodoxin domain-containing protein [Desulfatibacillaceae bacterium]
MPSALVVYDSKTGSTALMAAIAARALEEKGWAVVVDTADKAPEIEGHDLVLIGGPLRLGKPSKKLAGFVNANREYLEKTACAFFLSGVSLGIVKKESLPEIDIYIDPGFEPIVYDWHFANLMEYTHTVQYYLKHLYKHIGSIKPLGVGFFRGKMDFAELPLKEKLITYFIMIFIKDFEEKDYTSPKAVADWACRMAQKAEDRA